MLKALFIFEVFTFLFWFFGYIEKRLDKKAIINFKIYDVTDWTTNNYAFLEGESPTLKVPFPSSVSILYSRLSTVN